MNSYAFRLLISLCHKIKLNCDKGISPKILKDLERKRNANKSEGIEGSGGYQCIKNH